MTWIPEYLTRKRKRKRGLRARVLKRKKGDWGTEMRFVFVRTRTLESFLILGCGRGLLPLLLLLLLLMRRSSTSTVGMRRLYTEESKLMLAAGDETVDRSRRWAYYHRRADRSHWPSRTDPTHLHPAQKAEVYPSPSHSESCPAPPPLAPRSPLWPGVKPFPRPS